jgi:hypothetical protein
MGLRGSIYRDCGWDTDVSHDTEIKPRLCEKADSESANN